MKQLAWVAALALVASSPSDEVAFAPAANSSVVKELKVEVELQMADVSFNVNGADYPPEALGPIKDQKVLLNVLVGVTEKFVESKDGRPIDLLRTFDDLELKAEFGDNVEEGDDEARALEGRTVRFHWNEDSKEYDKSWHESEGDDAYLDDLVDDMDLRLLLPTKKVAEGDTWDVAGEELAPLFMPGGFVGGKDEDDDESSAAIEEELRGQLASFAKEFKVHCTYAGTRDEGGVKLADIQFTFEGAPKVDLGPLIERVTKEQEGPDADVVATAAADLKGEGQLLWNQAESRMHSFDMQSEIGLDANLEAQAEEQGQTFKIVISARASGKATWEMRAKKP